MSRRRTNVVIAAASAAVVHLVLAGAPALAEPQSGNLDLFLKSSSGHPVCGLEGWRNETGGGQTIRLPVFKSCRHLLTTSGFRDGRDLTQDERTLAEVVGQLFEGTIGGRMFTGTEWVFFGVEASHWVPAGCEAEIGRTGVFIYSIILPGRRALGLSARWKSCHDAAVESLVREYRNHPEVQRLDRLSRWIDSADLSNAKVMRRLNRLMLRQTTQADPPSTAEVLSILEGGFAPSLEDTDFGDEVYRRFKMESGFDTPLTVRARGTLLSRSGRITIRVDEGSVRLGNTDRPMRINSLDAGLCYQPIDEEQWRMISPGRSSEATLDHVLTSGDSVPLPRHFDIPLSQPLNLWRCWVCLRISAVDSPAFVFHARDASTLGCRTCSETSRLDES